MLGKGGRSLEISPSLTVRITPQNYPQIHVQPVKLQQPRHCSSHLFYSNFRNVNFFLNRQVPTGNKWLEKKSNN